MITSSLSPIAGTRVVRSSSTQGLSRELIRVQNWVGPKSTDWPILTRPSREISLFSALTASSRLPRSTSTVPTMSGTLAAILGLPGSKKWMARLGRAGISRTGAGAPTARGAKKSLAVRHGAEHNSGLGRAGMAERTLGRGGSARRAPWTGATAPGETGADRAGLRAGRRRSCSARAGQRRALGLDPGRTTLTPALHLGLDVASRVITGGAGCVAHGRGVDRLADRGVELLDLRAHLGLSPAIRSSRPSSTTSSLRSCSAGGRTPVTCSRSTSFLSHQSGSCSVPRPSIGLP